MAINKITNGYVIQVYDGPTCSSQEFIAGEVTYETSDGFPAEEVEGEVYQPFNMVRGNVEVCITNHKDRVVSKLEEILALAGVRDEVIDKVCVVVVDQFIHLKKEIL